MAEAMSVLGQVAPAATTETTLYDAAASTTAVVSSIVVCNRSAVDVTYRIYIGVDDAATSNEQYLVYDATIAPNDTVAYTLGITMGDTDDLRVYASTANLSFSAFGTEIT